MIPVKVTAAAAVQAVGVLLLGVVAVLAFGMLGGLAWLAAALHVAGEQFGGDV